MVVVQVPSGNRWRFRPYRRKNLAHWTYGPKRHRGAGRASAASPGGIHQCGQALKKEEPGSSSSRGDGDGGNSLGSLETIEKRSQVKNPVGSSLLHPQGRETLFPLFRGHAGHFFFFVVAEEET